jgi:uncharacterized protein YjcR
LNQLRPPDILDHQQEGIMTEEKMRHLGSEPPPQAPHKKKGTWKKPFAILIALIGIAASTYTVVGAIKGWFDPEPDAISKLDEIDKKLTAKSEDQHLVNQVSRRVTEFSDQYRRIQKSMKDIRRLDKSLSAKGPSGKILTPEQQKLIEASHKKETEELLQLVEKTREMAAGFCESVEEDETLSKVESEDSQTARTKARALKQVNEVKEKFLPELEKLQDKHSG